MSAVNPSEEKKELGLRVSENVSRLSTLAGRKRFALISATLAANETKADTRAAGCVKLDKVEEPLIYSPNKSALI